MTDHPNHEQDTLSPIPMKQCPCCNANGSLLFNHHGNNEYTVWCRNGFSCGLHTCSWMTALDAVTAWNRRPQND